MAALQFQGMPPLMGGRRFKDPAALLGLLDRAGTAHDAVEDGRYDLSKSHGFAHSSFPQSKSVDAPVVAGLVRLGSVDAGSGRHDPRAASPRCLPSAQGRNAASRFFHCS
ncbi:MAG: hypothetical protein M1376_10835 [Planctomycetes bacterium]|nr:hypothetical protein [Planctomycetota bacterium]